MGKREFIAEWMRLPENAVPGLEALMKESLEAGKLSDSRIPEELKPYFHYQFLGTTERDGRKVFEIGYYGKDRVGGTVLCP